MEIYLDESAVDLQASQDSSLEYLIRQVQTAHCPEDRVIVGIKADGVVLVDQDLVEALSSPAASFSCLELSTARPSELVSCALTEASSVLDQVREHPEQIARMLQEGKTSEAMSALTETLGVWQQVHDTVIKSLSMLSVDAEALDLGGEPLNQALEAPREQLVTVRNALRDQDYVLLADVLQYEFPVVFDRWDKLIAAVRERTSDKAS